VEKVLDLERNMELWRCKLCSGGIRTSEEIRTGKRLICDRCGSRLVMPGVPTFWEKVKLFWRTDTWFIMTGPTEFEKFEIPYPSVEKGSEDVEDSQTE